MRPGAVYKLPQRSGIVRHAKSGGRVARSVATPEMAASFPRPVILICALDFGRLNLDHRSLETGDAGHFVNLDAIFNEKGHSLPEESDCLVLAEDRRPAWSWRHPELRV
jgi:hypothetical protein